MKTKFCVWFLLLAAAFAQAQNNSTIVNGRVLDDQTGEPLTNFVSQTGMTNFMQPTEMFWQHYMMGNAQRPGQFSAKVEQNRPARIIASGYVPQILTEQSLANSLVDNLEIRLKRGDEFQGVVLDDSGRQAVGARVFLATVQRLYLMDGKFQYGEFRGGSTTADGTGHFALRGESGVAQKVVVVSADGNLIWPTLQSGEG